LSIENGWQAERLPYNDWNGANWNGRSVLSFIAL
jgi:hypothetical protein